MASEKKIILITGANSGVGYDTAYFIANASASNHVILSARSTEKGTKALSELQARKPVGPLSFLQLDITSDSSIAEAAKKIEADFGVIDVLVNNAGFTREFSLTGPNKETRENFHQIFDTNVFGHALLTMALEPLLKKSKDPRIINVTSSLGSLAYREDHSRMDSVVTHDAYRMSKAALDMLSLSQRWYYREWAKVWAYCPGWVVTNLTGEDDRENRAKAGAESSETSAQGILDIVEGKRDEETGSLVTRFGKVHPW